MHKQLNLKHKKSQKKIIMKLQISWKLNQNHNEHNWSTSFSLIAEMLKEFGEDDLFGGNELLEVVEFCLGIIL